MTSPPSAGFAVVTGGSSGIGLEIARELAGRGHDLILCAEDSEVGRAAEALRAHGTEVTGLVADLATPGGVDVLLRAVHDAARPVDVLVLNAGTALAGDFVDSDLDGQLRLVRLDVEAVVHIAHRLLPAMVDRGRGRVLVTSSSAASMPAPWNATYAAAKAFDHSFALAVRRELRGTGVTVTSLQPGPTATAIYARSGMTGTWLGRGPKSDPATVAAAAVGALLEGRSRVVVGVVARMQTASARILPERVRAAVQGAMTRPRRRRSARPVSSTSR